MLDGGSTGTRIHVYQFLYCNNEILKLHDEYFEEVKPGLSSFSFPKDAASSVEPLLKKALEIIPSHLHACTPIAFKATAGLRLLPGNLADAIMSQIVIKLEEYPFFIPNAKEKSSISVIDGSEEGVSAWITVNFLLESTKSDHLKTSLIMDLGGASTQIVFENDVGSHPKYYYPLDFASKKFNLYQHSFLGYGLMEARKKIMQSFLSSPEFSMGKGFSCFPEKYFKEFDGKMVNGTRGSLESCLEIIKNIFVVKDDCEFSPCTFDGVHLPDINNADNIHAFSYFYDRTQALNLPNKLTIAGIKDALSDACSISMEDTKDKHYKVIQENPMFCLDLAYIYTLLKFGYKMDDYKEITVSKKIKGYETGWCLGSTLNLMNEDVCRIK